MKIRISSKVLNILTRNLEHILIYMHFIYSIHYFHVILLFETIFFLFWSVTVANFRIFKIHKFRSYITCQSHYFTLRSLPYVYIALIASFHELYT